MAVSTPSSHSARCADTDRARALSHPAHALLDSHLAVALDLITEPWCNAILRAAFMGVRRFDDFQHVLHAPRQTLSLRLSYLVDIGLLRRQRLVDTALRQEYRLTTHGKALHGVVLASWAWDRRWGDTLRRIPSRLQHWPCGHTFRPQMVCEHCNASLALARARPVLVPAATATSSEGVRARNSRWRRPPPESADLAQRDILAVIDDRWSVLVVAAIMLGARSFDALSRSLEISSAVLPRRLQRLCALEVLRRAPDPQDARRAVYQLDRAGRELFPYMLALAQWGGTQTEHDDGVGWVHGACGKRAQGRMVCSHCRSPLLPHEVLRPQPPAAG